MTTPRAMASPATTSVLMVEPRNSRTKAAATSDVTMPVTATSAVRHW